MSHAFKVSTIRPPLHGQHCDVVVIGGGISGVAIARHCSRGGKRTLLVEKSDFAAGTTSRSTRIIHGGLRYLEHGDIAQVRESLKERQRLVRHHPNLVKPVEFLLALDGNSQRSGLAIRAGLWLYRQMGGRIRNEQQSEQARLERALDAGRRFSIFSFDDAQCEFPERLVAEWVVDASTAGCVVRNHTEVLKVMIHNGQVQGVLLRDQHTGREEQVSCSRVVNATGPWADRICQSSSISTRQPMVGGVRGSHMVLPKFDGTPDAAIYTEAVDGRPIFVIPWNGQILVGTTEVADNDDPARVHPSGEEIEYLLRSFQRLFPAVGVHASDITYAFAGVRPLPHSPGESPSALSRRHHLIDHSDDGARGMISVIGGKLTTAGWIARECGAKLGIKSIPSEPATVVSSQVIEQSLGQQAQHLSEVASICKESASGLIEWFGMRATDIANSVQHSEALRATLCPHTSHIVAEAFYSVQHEHATTLSDVLLRRVPVALGKCWSQECAHMAAQRIGQAVGWDTKETGNQLEQVEAEFENFLQKPSRVVQ